jgi:hypothetical protein
LIPFLEELAADGEVGPFQEAADVPRPYWTLRRSRETPSDLRLCGTEGFLVFNSSRPSRARARRGEPISVAHATHTLSDLKMRTPVFVWASCATFERMSPNALS